MHDGVAADELALLAGLHAVDVRLDVGWCLVSSGEHDMRVVTVRLQLGTAAQLSGAPRVLGPWLSKKVAACTHQGCAPGWGR